LFGSHQIDDPNDELGAACGGRVGFRLLASRSDGAEHDLGTPIRPYLLLGRSEQCDVRLEGSDVSHRHAYIQFIGNRIFCADLGSRTGVHWHNGRRASGWVKPSERIAIGQYSLRFERLEDSDGEVALQDTRPDDAKRPDAILQFLNASIGSDRIRSWQPRRTVTLMGHLPTCDLPLNHSSVSRVHASLLRTPSGVWVIDLLGKDGVLVNGESVASARLENRDLIRIGRFRISVEFPSEHERLATDLRQFASSQDRPSRPLLNGHASSPTKLSPNAISVNGQKTGGSLSVHQTGTELSDPSLSGQSILALLRQSASMQQQMLDQQKLIMTLMTKLVSGLPNHASESVRGELEQIHSLDREMSAIRAKLTDRSQNHSPIDHANNGTSPVASPDIATTDRHEPAPAIACPPPSRWTTDSTSDSTNDKDNGDLDDEPTAAVMAESNSERPKQTAIEDVELESPLVHRLAELERQRNGYWRKIIRALSG